MRDTGNILFLNKVFGSCPHYLLDSHQCSSAINRVVKEIRIDLHPRD